MVVRDCILADYRRFDPPDLAGDSIGSRRKIRQNLANANGLQIVDLQRRSFLRGPFFLTSRISQSVYRVWARDHDGIAVDGWIRCNGWFFGLLNFSLDVRWNKAKFRVAGFPVVLQNQSNV